MTFANESQVKSDIKSGNLKYCYVIFGEDRYLKKKLTYDISDVVAEKDDFFNFQQFDNDSDLQEVYDSLQQYPVMSEKKCVILKDYDIEGCAKSDFERILSLCSENISTAVFILWFDYNNFDIKKSDRFKKLCTATEKGNGRNVNITFRTNAELTKMLCDGAKKRNCNLKRETALFMIETVGNEIETLKNELEKLCFYVKNGDITENDIKNVCIESVEQSVYNLSGNILSGNVENALKILDELFFLRVEPMAIFYTVAGVYVDLGRAYAVKKQGISTQEAVKIFAYKNKAFLFERALRQVGKLDLKRIRLSLNELNYTDKRLKSYSADSREILEEMIVRLSFIATEGREIDKT